MVTEPQGTGPIRPERFVEDDERAFEFDDSAEAQEKRELMAEILAEVVDEDEVESLFAEDQEEE